jgi:DNA-binding CsgD family transcriptional regulator
MNFEPSIVPQILVPIADRLDGTSNLTPAERLEMIRILQGFACKDSAAAANVSPETIRARRKRIYRKLHLAGANELISAVFRLSLEALARGERQAATGHGSSAGAAGG